MKNILPKHYMLTEYNMTKNHNNSAMVLSPSKTNSSRTDSDEAKAPSSSKKTHKHNKSKKKLKVVSGLIVSVLFKFLICIRGRVKDLGPAIFSPLIKKAKDLAFLEKEDGLVYKAELLGSNGKIIAIKKIIQLNPIDGDELAKEVIKLMMKKMRKICLEIQIAGQIRHQNLLPLLAHVPRIDFHYLDVLNKVSEGKRELDWLVRHKIVLGVATSLEYLHMHHNPRIIHKDLKPENILLNDDMEARIADFGLEKAVPEMNTHVTTSNVAGTVGYIKPEYH
uniref:non-specific serine/threonine protein kinase n=1 Tax=Nelumbo nucifera TaxID=4432 RepID=A0A822Z2A2_NELNU|nr:TPA_asm: hypothetical protein HUJ06_013239 [Nelumbo nucifera]